MDRSPAPTDRTLESGEHGEVSAVRNVPSSDGVRISCERTGTSPTALVFVHGWLGSGRWWDTQRDAFSRSFTVIQLDLAGHGVSGRERTKHSADAYVDDIVSVANALDVEQVVLVGHSMSGVYVTLAAARLPRVVAVVLVDIPHNVEQVMPRAQVDEMLALYRRDFRTAVEQVAPRYLFAPSTPPEVVATLQHEFLQRTGSDAAMLLEPLYGVDACRAAEQLKIPVRAINSDLQPTDVEANRRHFRDYAMREISGVGHYPMLEAPERFNTALSETLKDLGVDT